MYADAASPASSDAVRPRVSGIHIPGSTLVRTRLTAEEIERLAPSPPQPSLVFHSDCREMFEANPSRHGVDRRLSFDDKAENSFWTGPKKGNLASPDAVVRELPPMPAGAPRWAREIWAAQGGGAAAKM